MTQQIFDKKPEPIVPLGTGYYNVHLNIIKFVENETDENDEPIEVEKYQVDVLRTNDTSYEGLVSKLIRTKYSEDEEFSIQRQKDSKPEKFIEYNSFCENVKKEVSLLLGKDYTPPIDLDLVVFCCNPFLQTKSVEELKSIDITLLDLRNEKTYIRGYKVESNYYNKNDELAVKIKYELLDAGEKRVIEWFKNDGTIAFDKESIEHYTVKDWAKKKEEIRKTEILYLQNPEVEFLSEDVRQYISILFQHYKTEINDYILSGSSDFLDAVHNETNIEINAILDAVLPDDHTIRQSINFQLTGSWDKI